MAIVWKDRGYSSYGASVARGLELNVWWEGIHRLATDGAHWNVSVFGEQWNKRFHEKEEAQKAAEASAKTILESAILRLTSA